jgi:hypothetical protein
VTDPKLRQLVEDAVRAALARRVGCGCGGACGSGGAACGCGGTCSAGRGACGCAESSTAPPPAVTTRRTVFIFCGAEEGERDAREYLATVRRRHGVEVLATAEHAARHDLKWLREDAGDAPLHTCLDADARDGLLRRTGLVAIPSPSRTLVARTALGLADDDASALLTEALMRGVPVVLGVGDTDPATWRPGVPGPMRSGPRSLGEIMADHLLTLERWGARVRRGGEFLREVERLATLADQQAMTLLGSPSASSGPASRFITSEDIRTAHRNGRREVELDLATRITDEALAVARDLGVAVTRKSP